MKLNLKKPLVFFDLETTGTNTSTDRIVELCFVKILMNGEKIVKTSKINPTIPIPLESSLIHGIYDKDVKDSPTFGSIAKALVKFLDGCDIGGFNILKFDIPLLMEEFHRAGEEFDLSDRNLIDAQKIFHSMEKRTLGAAYQFYCNKTLDDAHSAEADTMATYEVFEAQITKYDNQQVTDYQGNESGVIQNDMQHIHKLFNQNIVDLKGCMVYKNGVEVFNFGKHKGKEVATVLQKEHGYYDWMMKNDFPIDTKKKLSEIHERIKN